MKSFLVSRGVEEVEEIVKRDFERSVTAGAFLEDTMHSIAFSKTRLVDAGSFWFDMWNVQRCGEAMHAPELQSARSDIKEM